MNFTGERVIPGVVDPDLFNEHWARYLFACRFAKGKNILDAACGSGYGSGLLAETARRVVGIDLAPDAVAYAKQHYDSPKTAFIQANGLALPFAPSQFDLVVALEIVEHLKNAQEFLKELRRILAPSGMLIVSTPNRLYYTEDRGEVNPFHEREYSYDEFSELLGTVFPYHTILLQNHISAVMIADAKQSCNLHSHSPELLQQESDSGQIGKREREAYFMIALCSTERISATPPLLYVPSTGNVLRERETHIKQLELQLAEAREERVTALNHLRERDMELAERTQWAQKLQGELQQTAQWAKDLDQRLLEKDAYVLQLQADYDQKVEWALALQREIEQARAALQKLQSEFEERTAWALRLNTEVEDRKHELRLLYDSRWYRTGKKLGLTPAPASDQLSRQD